MNGRINKILPKDGFILSINGSLPIDYVQALTHLYQPLVGHRAIMLYQTLYSEYQLNFDSDQPKTHHSLMNLINFDLDQIYSARVKLEGIGLLQAFEITSNDHRIMHYTLKPPFGPTQFFNDNMLSLLLFHHLPAEQYEKLKSRIGKKALSYDGQKDVTQSFDDVFTTLSTNKYSKQSQEQTNVEQLNESNISDTLTVDVDWLNDAFNQQGLPTNKFLSKSNVELFNNLTRIYQLTTTELEKAIFWSITDDNELAVKELKEACHDLYTKKFGIANPKLIDKSQPEHLIEKKEPKTKADKLIYHLEKISPKELLEDFSSKGQASNQEVKMIIDIMDNHGLPPGVMNVLIHYVMLKSDMKLTKSYVEKIATHWSRKRVTTVREAMGLAKTESKQYQQWGTRKSKKNWGAKEEVLPDWFKDQQAKKQEAKPEKEVDNKEESKDFDLEKEELARALQNMSSKS